VLPDKPGFGCEEAEQNFSAYMEQELEDANKKAFEKHLRSCPKCEEGYISFCSALDALKSYTPVKTPCGFIDSVCQAARHDAWSRRRKWPLVVSWCITAAAVLLAFLTYMSKPKEIVIEKPVDREVIVEREIKVPVEISVPTPVLFPVRSKTFVQEGAIDVIRDNEVVRVKAGESLQFEEGDAICVKPEKIMVTQAKSPVRLVFDFLPLSAAIRQASIEITEATHKMRAIAIQATKDNTASEVEQKKMVAKKTDDRSPMWNLEDQALYQSAKRPPVAIVLEDSGAVELETNGPDHLVIPELISLLDNRNPQVSAAALDRLKCIQLLLTREHRIDGLENIRLAASEPSTVDNLKTFFSKDVEIEIEEYTTTEQWEIWWAANKQPIRRLAMGYE